MGKTIRRAASTVHKGFSETKQREDINKGRAMREIRKKTVDLATKALAVAKERDAATAARKADAQKTADAKDKVKKRRAGFLIGAQSAGSLKSTGSGGLGNDAKVGRRRILV